MSALYVVCAASRASPHKLSSAKLVSSGPDTDHTTPSSSEPSKEKVAITFCG